MATLVSLHKDDLFHKYLVSLETIFLSQHILDGGEPYDLGLFYIDANGGEYAVFRIEKQHVHNYESYTAYVFGLDEYKVCNLNSLQLISKKNVIFDSYAKK